MNLLIRKHTSIPNSYGIGPCLKYLPAVILRSVALTPTYKFLSKTSSSFGGLNVSVTILTASLKFVESLVTTNLRNVDAIIEL